MSQPTYFVPIAFARPATTLLSQEPKSSDTPTGAPSTTGGAGPTGTSGTQGGSGPNPAQPQDPCGGGMLWMMPLFLVLMYFMMIRPEQKRRKEQTALLSSIRQGDRVVTVSGMHGVVSRLTDKTVTLRVDSVEITFDRSAVGRIVRDEPATPAGS